MTKHNILQAIKYLGTSGDSFLDIENYERLRFSTERVDCHHRREITEGKTAQELFEEGKYFNVPASDLIFLTHREHSVLHTKSKTISEDPKRKISKSNKGTRHSIEQRIQIWKKHLLILESQANDKFGIEHRKLLHRRCIRMQQKISNLEKTAADIQRQMIDTKTHLAPTEEKTSA